MIYDSSVLKTKVTGCSGHQFEAKGLLFLVCTLTCCHGLAFVERLPNFIIKSSHTNAQWTKKPKKACATNSLTLLMTLYPRSLHPEPPDILPILVYDRPPVTTECYTSLGLHPFI